MAERSGGAHHEVVVGRDDFIGALPRLSWYRDEPIAEPSEIPLLLLAFLGFAGLALAGLLMLLAAQRDEFDAHAIEFAYPPEVVAAAEATAEHILDKVVHAQAPFDVTGRSWLERVLTSAPMP